MDKYSLKSYGKLLIDNEDIEVQVIQFKHKGKEYRISEEDARKCLEQSGRFIECPNCGSHLDCSDKGSYW